MSLSLPCQTLTWLSIFPKCELNYRCLILSELKANRAFGEDHGYFITNEKINTQWPGVPGESTVYGEKNEGNLTVTKLQLYPLGQNESQLG